MVKNRIDRVRVSFSIASQPKLGSQSTMVERDSILRAIWIATMDNNSIGATQIPCRRNSEPVANLWEPTANSCHDQYGCYGKHTAGSEHARPGRAQ
jgi:hypothetical protein